ncbi:hypothetical protein PCG10_000443 [Penicillium crustosum]|uniref:Uncharacterized protein n=1 Tax=Penicillium crustosum TaxID=36656 RepID=A0A9P5KZH3_PENCR|nr:hypothetical protein PCG10_000443 [Penicillium crustosum]
MEQPAFIFLNATGSSLSPPAAKRMRAHITKTNFAKRRQHAHLTGSEQKEQRKHQSQQLKESEKPKSNQLTTSLPPKSTSSELARDATASVRHWSPDNAWQLKACRHSYAAVHLIKQRITSTGTRTDGVLGAVTTLAFGATLEQDDVAWNVHIIGLAHMIKDRKYRAMTPPPSWMTDLVVQDSVNAIFNFPRLYHERILEAMIDYNDQRILRLKGICDSVIQLQKMIDSHHQHQFDATLVAREIEEPLAQLHYKVRALRAIDDVYVQATARAIELVLYLLWPSKSGAYLTLLAEELKEAICRFPIKGCSYMNLTSFPLMIGAIAADENSLARAWFVDRLAREVRAMQLRGWNRPLSLLQNKYYNTNTSLMGRFKSLWHELHYVANDLDD